MEMAICLLFVQVNLNYYVLQSFWRHFLGEHPPPTFWFLPQNMQKSARISMSSLFPSPPKPPPPPPNLLSLQETMFHSGNEPFFQSEKVERVRSGIFK